MDEQVKNIVSAIDRLKAAVVLAAQREAEQKARADVAEANSSTMQGYIDALSAAVASIDEQTAALTAE